MTITIIAEVIVSLYIFLVFGQQNTIPQSNPVLRHPALIVVIFFLVSWILGFFLFDKYNDNKSARDVEFWKTVKDDLPQGGCFYIKEFPKGIFVSSAEDNCSFFVAQRTDKPEIYCGYLHKFPVGQYSKQAKVECAKKISGSTQADEVLALLNAMYALSQESQKEHEINASAIITSKADRSPPEEQQKTERFVINIDGTVNDTESGLMWMRCPVGALLTKAAGERLTCKQADAYTWDEAQKIYSFSVYNDWRLPDLDQLKELHDLKEGDEIKGSAYINKEAFPMPNCKDDWFQCTFWSSSNTPINYDQDADRKAWVAYFQSPHSSKFVLRDTRYMVRLVRTITQ